MLQKQIIQNLKDSQAMLAEFTSDENNITAVENAVNILVKAFKNGNKVMSCGNGGSMCDAMHFAEELSGRFRNDRKPLPALSISDSSHITCTGNDYGFDHIFSRFIEGLGNKGDVLLAISTSGNSVNIIKAASAAKEKNMLVIGLTGKDGGKLAGLCDIEIRAPKSDYADRIQELHIKIIHSLIHGVELEMFPN